MRLGVVPLKFFRFIKRFEILDSLFLPLASPVGISSVFPRRDISAFYKTDILLPRYAISSHKVRGIMAVFDRRDKAKIASSIVESISINMIYEGPSVRRLAYNVIMDEIGLMPSIPVVRKIEPFACISILPNIYVDFRISYKFVPIIMQRSFDEIVMKYSLSYDALPSYRRKGDTAPSAFALRNPSCFSSFLNIFVRHKRIISRIKKFHNKEVYFG